MTVAEIMVWMPYAFLVGFLVEPMIEAWVQRALDRR